MQKDNGWGEHGGYMTAKIQKLDKQFKSNTKKKLSNIFADICIFINGFTDLPDNEIKDLMHLHGGRFCHYYNKQVVTHIIASNLPNSKINKLKNEKVVTCNWIIDSINSGKLLDWSKYELYAERHQSNQNMMKNFVQKADQDNGRQIETGALALDEYYAKSRLHHLSTWATELKNYLQSLKASAYEKSNDGDITFLGRLEFLQFCKSQIEKNIITISEPILMHIDMDCFFVSVGIKNKPELKGHPVVVTHSTRGHGSSSSTAGSMSEIASCSYETRKYGIKNGMHLGKAKTLCSNLITIPYNFEEYLDVAKTLYRIASRFTHDIEVGSCDELYIDLIDILKVDQESDSKQKLSIIDPMVFAEYFRMVIKNETKCSASCGIGSNLLICKLATKRAKPDGKYWLKTSDVVECIKEMNVRDLPGIGRVLEDKLKSLNITKCEELQNISLEKLKSNFGSKTGQRLYDMSRGKDNRIIQTDRQRKSISVEMNYGIRLNSMTECEDLLTKVAGELSKRLIKSNVKGAILILKLMIRHPDASVESVKYLGHGYCNNFSKSIKLTKNTNDAAILAQHSIRLYKELKADIKELRGVGLVMQKLETEANINSKPNENLKIENFFLPKCMEANHRSDNFDFVKNHFNEIQYVSTSDEDCNDDCLITDCFLSNIHNDKNCLSTQNNEQILIDSSISNEITLQLSTSNFVIENSKKLCIEQEPTKSNNISKINSKPDKVLPKKTPQLSNKNQLTISHMFESKNLNVANESIEQNTIEYLANLGNTSVDKFKEVIGKWVESESVPDIEDTILIRNQIASMVSHRAEWVIELMKHFDLSIELVHGGQENADIWKQCYYDILAIVQSLAFQEFGAELEFD